MKKALLILLLLGVCSTSFARVRYVQPYIRSNGTYVNGYYRDTSNDGNPYNNANYLGYNNSNSSGSMTWNTNATSLQSHSDWNSGW